MIPPGWLFPLWFLSAKAIFMTDSFCGVGGRVVRYLSMFGRRPGGFSLIAALMLNVCFLGFFFQFCQAPCVAFYMYKRYNINKV